MTMVSLAGKNPATKQQAVITINSKPRSVEDTIHVLDWPLIIFVVALALFGAVMIVSASMPYAAKNYSEPFYFAIKQLILLTFGLGVGFAVFKVSVTEWEKYGLHLMVAALILLALVLVPGIGKIVNGSRRWLDLGLISVQVSELVKLFIIIYLAGYLVRRGEQVRTRFKAFIIPLFVICLASGLLMAEPDFGATVVIVLTAMGMLWIGGAKAYHFISLISVFASLAYVLVVQSPYRMRRLASFWNPWDDPFNSGFQLSQSLIAIGSGSWSGAGLGNSVQKLFYLPEAHTDFLFAVMAEELGLFGIFLVIGIYSFIVWRCFNIAVKAERHGNRFSSYVAIGIGIWIGLQAFINMGVNMGILPTKGITLPLMSYGGSSVVVFCVTFAILLRIDYESRKLQGRKLRRNAERRKGHHER